MNLSDKLYGNLVKILKTLSIVAAIVVFFVFFIAAIMYFAASSGNGAAVGAGIIYLLLAPFGGFLAGISLYALARHFENQDKMIENLEEIKFQAREANKKEN